MRLVMEERVEVDAILAMTFTEAAANEMKKRLAAALQSAYDTSTKEEEKAYITRQLTSIQLRIFLPFTPFVYLLFKIITISLD